MIVSLYIIKLDFEIVYIKSNLLSFDFFNLLKFNIIIFYILK